MMNRVFLFLGLSILLPVSFVRADLSTLNQIPISNLPTTIMTTPELTKSQTPDIAQVPLKSVKKHHHRLKMEDLDIADNDQSGMSVGSAQHKRQYDRFLAEVSPEYSLNNGFLHLIKVPYQRSKRSIMFVMLMNHNYSDDADDSRGRLHILWPGSKKIKLEQKLIKDDYPIDVSIANYEDGYAAGEWNLVLPYKKPREVKVSLLWVF